MKPALSAALLSLLALTAACADGDDGDASASTTATASTSSAGTTSASTTGASTGDPSTGTTTSGPTTAGETSTGATSTSTGETATSTGGPLCDALPAGPFTPELIGGPFDGSEDLGFDGQGRLAGKLGDAVVLIDSALAATTLATPVAKAYGLRFMLGGDLVVALPSDGKVLRITPEGAISELVGGLQSPNGIFPDLAGDVWITDFAGAQVLRANAEGGVDVIVSGAEATSANGVIFDPDRGLLFYTNYGSGRIARAPIDGGGQAGAPAAVAMIPGSPDGLALDACGNLYVVDQQKSRLYRIWLDPAGAAIGDPELLAELPSNVANAVFGRGEGWDPDSLYLAGNPGDVYRIALGVGGAPVP